MFSVVHFVNQFFAGLDGEDRAGTPVGVLKEPSPVTRALQSQLAERAQVVATIS